jgi:hypothetical protein
MMGHVGYQGDVAGALNRYSQGPLVLGANAGTPPGFDFGAVGHEAANFVDFLVVDVLDVFHAEGANAAARREPSPGPAAGTPSRPASARTSSGAPLGAGWSGSIAPGGIARWPGSFGGHLNNPFVFALESGPLKGKVVYFVVASAPIADGSGSSAIRVAAHAAAFAAATEKLNLVGGNLD